MSTLFIEESGMRFGPYPEGHCFTLEQSKTYKAIQGNVKIAEFLLIRPVRGKASSDVWIVEAKSSSPSYNIDQQRFAEFIKEIHEKLLNAFSLGIACLLKRHPQTPQ